MFRRGLVWLAFSVGAGACASALTACSLLLGEGFTDPNAEQPSNDSGPGATDGPNGGGDGSTTDGGPGDGSTPGPDGSNGGDGGNSACPVATVSFCDGFERTNQSDVKGAWDEVILNASGTLGIGASATTVGTTHLESSVFDTGGQGQLRKVFAHQPTRLHMELSLTLKAFSSVGGVYVAGVGMPNGVGAPSLAYLFFNTGTLYFVQQVANNGGYVNDAIPITKSTKQRIVVDLTFNGRVTVKVEGNTKLDANAQTYLVPTPPSLYLGAWSIDGTGDDGAFDVDDFVFTMD